MVLNEKGRIMVTRKNINVFREWNIIGLTQPPRNVPLSRFVNFMNELTENQVMKIGEFYMAYEFGNMLNSDESLDIDEKEFIKFMVLGWYIYCVILRSKKFNDMPKLIKIKEE